MPRADFDEVKSPELIMHTTSAQDKLALYQITHFLEQNLAPQDRGLSSE